MRRHVALILLSALAAMAVACEHQATPGPSSHRLGAQIPAAQTGQGPIPEFADTTSLGAFPTTGMATGFIATSGSSIYVYTSTISIATDAGAGAGNAVVAGANGGGWLLVSTTSGVSLSVVQSGLYSLPTEGGVSTLPWTTASVLVVSGVLLANATVNLPNVPGMQWTVHNSIVESDGGAFTVTVQASGGTGFVLGLNKSAIGYIDASSGTTGNLVRATPDT